MAAKNKQAEGKEKELVTRSTADLLLGTHVMNQNGRKTALSELAKDNEVIGIYFSAHWCGPCKRFTPQLMERYTNWKKIGRPLSIVFISLDKNQEAFDEYYRSMHSEWFTIPFKESERRQCINDDQNTAKATPFLMFVDSKTGEVLAKNGRTIVEQDPNAVDFPWKNYTVPYRPPNVWNRVIIRVVLFIGLMLFYRFYK